MDRLLESELFVQAMDAANDGITITDYRKQDNPIVFVNKAFETMTGYSSSEIVSKNCRFLQGNDHNQKGVEVVREAIKKGEPCRVDLRNYRKDGTLFWNELSLAPLRDKDHQITHFVGIQKDITKQKLLEDTLFSETREDPLTHLLNRRGFDAETKQMPLKDLALFLIDIDDFKKINDCYGHSKGDEVLVEVANFLKEKSDKTARYGGDEFILIGKKDSLEEDLKQKMKELSNKIGFPVTFSIGMASLSEKRALSDAIQEADAAMYKKKKQQKSRSL